MNPLPDERESQTLPLPPPDSRRWAATTITINAPTTARQLLFGDATQPVPAGGWGAATGRLPARVRPLADRELGAAMAELLDFDLGEVLLAGWRTHSALVAAARATAANPMATELVTLLAHHISSAHRPQVGLTMDGMRVATARFDVEIAADIDGLLATVRGGRLVALHGGRCVVRIGLYCAGAELITRIATLQPPRIVSLGQGVPLLDGGPPPMARGRAAVPLAPSG